MVHDWMAKEGLGVVGDIRRHLRIGIRGRLGGNRCADHLLMRYGCDCGHLGFKLKRMVRGLLFGFVLTVLVCWTAMFVPWKKSHQAA